MYTLAEAVSPDSAGGFIVFVSINWRCNGWRCHSSLRAILVALLVLSSRFRFGPFVIVVVDRSLQCGCKVSKSFEIRRSPEYIFPCFQEENFFTGASLVTRVWLTRRARSGPESGSFL